MDLQIFVTFSTFVFTFLFFLGMLLKQSRKSKVNSLSLPPGPSKLPVIGNLHQLLGLPHHLLRDLANIYGPLMSLKLGQLPLVIVSSPSVASQMMKTHDLAFVDRPFNLSSKIMSYEGRGVVMAPYGEYWRQMRRICILELLSVRRVQSFWSIRQEEVSNLVQRISLMVAGSPINLSEKLCTLINDITARAAFGKTCKDKQAFISGMKDLTRSASGFAISDLFPPLKFLEVISGTKARLESAHQKIDKLLDDIVRDHKENSMAIKDEEDLVDVLLRVQEDSGLEFPITPEHLKAVIFDVFSAGTETSSTALEWTFSELLKNRRVMEKVQAEARRVLNGRINEISQEDLKRLNYLRLVIKETLRLHPSAPLLLPRECRETCKIEGCEIPKGTKVMVNAWAIGRDPKHWRDPESYEPERFQDKDIDYKGNNFEYIPFGAGRRICPGISFGVANVELPLALLLYHFDWKLAYQVKPEELNMTEAFGVIVGRKTHLFVIATPNNPLYPRLDLKNEVNN